MQSEVIKFSGKVIKGIGSGTALGFPTVNFDVKNAPKGLAHGVYAVKVNFGEGDFFSAMHFGPRATMKGNKSLEIHIIGFSGDLYGKNVEVEVLRRLRDIKKFANKEELVEAIKTDIIGACRS